MGCFRTTVCDILLHCLLLRCLPTNVYVVEQYILQLQFYLKRVQTNAPKSKQNCFNCLTDHPAFKTTQAESTYPLIISTTMSFYSSHTNKQVTDMTLNIYITDHFSLLLLKCF